MTMVESRGALAFRPGPQSAEPRDRVSPSKDYFPIREKISKRASPRRRHSNQRRDLHSTDSTRPSYSRSPLQNSHKKDEPSFRLDSFTPIPLVLTPRQTIAPSFLVSSTSIKKPRSETDLLTQESLVAVASLLSKTSSSSSSTEDFDYAHHGILHGSQLFTTPHTLPIEYISRLPAELRETAQCYVSFPGISIAVPGTYRLRISLLRMPGITATSQTAETIAMIDSAIVRVCDRRGSIDAYDS